MPDRPRPETKTMSKLPTLFIPHGGGPCFFMDWDPPDTWLLMAEYLRRVPDDVGTRPKALVVISGIGKRKSPPSKTIPPHRCSMIITGFRKAHIRLPFRPLEPRTFLCGSPNY